MAAYPHTKAGTGSKCSARNSLRDQLSSLSIRSPDRDLQPRLRDVSQPGYAKPTKKRTTTLSHSPFKQNSSPSIPQINLARSQKASLARKIPRGSLTQPKRNVAVSSSSMEDIELEWLPSENFSHDQVSFQITLELLIAPKRFSTLDAWRFSHGIVDLHNQEVPIVHPRMHLREYCEQESTERWDLIMVGGAQNGSSGQAMPGTSRSVLLSTFPNFHLFII